VAVRSSRTKTVSAPCVVGSVPRLSKGDDDDGCNLPCPDDRFLWPFGGNRLRLRTAEEAIMTWLYALSGLIALAITIYLVVALLYPEKF
jgi:K+-transporting ATPase KdpF subunit